MIKYLYLIFSFPFLYLSALETQAEGYDIKVRIKNLPDKEIILGHHFADKLYPDDTLKLDNTGFGTLKGDTKYPEGIYFFMTPSRAMFDFFMTSNQHFTAETDTVNLFDKLSFENSPENTDAQEYLKFLVTMQKESADLQERKKKMTDSIEIKKTDSRLVEISAEHKSKTNGLITGQKDNFVGQFIQAVQAVVIPEPPKDTSGIETMSPELFRWYLWEAPE